jgi:hypothetical protein
VRANRAPYTRNDKPIHRRQRVHDSDFAIAAKRRSEYRGIVNYYRMAHNPSRLDTLRWTMKSLLLKRLAATTQTDEGPGRKALLAEWGWRLAQLASRCSPG